MFRTLIHPYIHQYIHKAENVNLKANMAGFKQMKAQEEPQLCNLHLFSVERY